MFVLALRDFGCIIVLTPNPSVMVGVPYSVGLLTFLSFQIMKMSFEWIPIVPFPQPGLVL